MSPQLISQEKFTNIQKAQAGLTRLFKHADKTRSFYRVLKNDQPLGVLIPNKVWEDFLEDLEASSSENFKKRIAASRRSKKLYTAEEVKKELGF